MAKEKAVKRDPKRFKVLEPISMFSLKTAAAGRTPTPEEVCELLDERTNELIKKRCAAKANGQSSGVCAGEGGQGRPTAVDLVILIDTSGSMDDEATGLSNSASAAIQAAAQNCPSDLRVAWFGIEGTWAGTNFNQSYRAYLNGIGIGNGLLSGTIGDTEDGAAAVFDICRHYDWRPSATKLIFFLGDEGMDNGDPQDATDVASTNAAITEAQAQGVQVFTYLGTGNIDPATANDYSRLAVQTGGQAFVAPIANLGGFETVLQQIICTGSRADGCKTVELPKISPCFQLHWGDGKNDQIETDDWEVLCIGACNPYDNITIKDLIVHIVVLNADGTRPANLPDGSPSVFVVPDYQICFGDLSPCSDEALKNKSNCVAREVMLMTRGAIEQGYIIVLAYCFEVCFHTVGVNAAFKFDLVKS